MSRTKAYGFAAGYFNPPLEADDDLIAHALWAESCGQDFEPGDVCAICITADANDLSGLCSACEMNEDGALERDTVNPYEQ